EPLDARLWRHEVEAQPLTTPEARAGLRQRLLDHAATIGDPALARLYRAAWLDRFVEQLAPKRTSAPGWQGRTERLRPSKRKPREKTKDEVFLNPWGLQDS